MNRTSRRLDTIKTAQDAREVVLRKANAKVP